MRLSGLKIASFPAIMARIDKIFSADLNTTVKNELVGTYQFDSDGAYCFNNGRQYSNFSKLNASVVETSGWKEAC